MAKRALDDILTSVANATVWFPKRKGQGVLMEGGTIVTAAHCLPLRWANKTGAGWSMEDHTYFDFITARGDDLKGAPVAVEAVADVAALVPPDGQTFPEGYSAYREWRKQTRPVKLFLARFSKFPAEFPVYIRTHKKTWIEGKATVFYDCQNTISVESKYHIKRGTSGGPIITPAGELVSVVSCFTNNPGEKLQTGTHPLLRWALPAWICREICRERRG